jgi:electron transfer flavoprotein beta subunit
MTAQVRHEVEGGLERIVEIELPAVVTIQTGINEPRYVSIRGIRRVAGVEIPVEAVAAEDVSVWTTTDEMSIPKVDKRAEILEGSPEEVVDTLIQRLKERAGV